MKPRAMETRIHPTAVVAPGAELGLGVEIGPHSVVGPRVRIGDGTRVGPQVVIDGVTTLGQDNHIVGQSSLGAPPQDLSHRGEPTRLEIGNENEIREFVTINCGTVKGGGVTRIGSGNMLMACCHVAHDCEIADHVILANNSLLGGHVRVESHVSISVCCAAYPFVTIGQHAYVGSLSRMSLDVPPYMLIEGRPSRPRKVNVIGLTRSGFPAEDIDALRKAFRLIYRSGKPLTQSLEILRSDPDQPACVGTLVAALERSESGVSGRYRESLREEFTRAGRALILGEEAS